MMEDLPMMDALYATDAEMADYDYDYDIPESVMQDEGDIVTAKTLGDTTEYSSAQVQEFDMSEDAQELYADNALAPDNSIETEPTTAPPPAPIEDTAVEVVPTEEIIVVDVTADAPAPIAEPIPIDMQPDIQPDQTNDQQPQPQPIPISPLPAPIEENATTHPIEEIVEDIPVHAFEDNEPAADTHPQIDVHITAPEPSVAQPEEPQTSLPEPSPVDAQPTPQPSDPAEAAEVSAPPTHQTAPEPLQQDQDSHVPSVPAITCYYDDQPYHLFVNHSTPRSQAGPGTQDTPEPTVLLSGKLDLFRQPLATFFKSIREHEKANFSFISEQYLIGLEYTALELYIDESSVYAQELTLADICKAVVACGHELTEFTLYQADDFKYLLRQRTQGIPPPLPEGSAESQEEDTPEYGTQHTNITQEEPIEPAAVFADEDEDAEGEDEEDFSAVDVVQPSFGEPSLPSQELDIEERLVARRSSSQHEPLQVSVEVPIVSPPSANESKPTQAVAPPATPTTASEFTYPATADENEPVTETDGTAPPSEVANEPEQQDEEQDYPETHVPEGHHEQGPNDIPDGESDGTLESSQHDEEYQDDANVDQVEPEAHEDSHTSTGPATDDNKSEAERPTDDSTEDPADDVYAQNTTGEEENTKSTDWGRTEPSVDGSAVPDDLDEYSYYDDADAEYEEDEAKEDQQSATQSAVGSPEEQADLVDFQEDIPQPPASPVGKGKRSLSEIDEAHLESQYTSQDLHADPKRARVR